MTIPVSDTEPVLTLQITAVLLVPFTVALNCWLFPEAMRVAVGEIATLMFEPASAKIAKIRTNPTKAKEFGIASEKSC